MAKDLQIDSGILQFAPKGQFYEETDEQFQAVLKMWTDLLQHDRVLFGLITILNGTGYSKGRMNHMLLSNPQAISGTELVPEGLNFDYEQKVIMYNLEKERTPRALKNLLMLAGGENQKRVNNSRSRKIILEYIFNRENKSLDWLSVNYKTKLKKLVRHALGKQDLYNVLNGDKKLFQKFIGRYNRHAFPVLQHLFDYQVVFKKKTQAYFPKIEQYHELKAAAKSCDVGAFKKVMKGMPDSTVLGFRNLYKVPIELSEIYEKTNISSRKSIQTEAAVKRSGAKAKVNYKNQDIYDLWKALYFKLLNNDPENMSEIVDAIDYQSKKLSKIDLGEDTIVIIDASRSMYGSELRPLHPFLTSLSILSTIENVKDVIYVGGKIVKSPHDNAINFVVPSGHTDLWRGLVDAVLTGAKNIVLISDGYENTIKGVFNTIYKHFKKTGFDFDLLHLNPVFSSDAKSGTARKLTEDSKPLPVSNYKFLESEIIFNKMIENSELVKNLLVEKYNKLIEGGKSNVNI